MSQEESVGLAIELLKLGVSNTRVSELLVQFPNETIRRQLDYLPYRKAKRPEAFVIDAIRHDYSPPKEFFYAQDQTDNPTSANTVDQGSQRTARPLAPEAEGHGTEGLARAYTPDDWLEAGGAGSPIDLPLPDAEDRA